MDLKICEDCTEFNNGKCKECFNQSCIDIDDCPLGCTEATASEIQEMENNAKKIKRYEQSTKQKKQTKKVRKVDLQKLEILIALSDTLANKYDIRPTIEKEVNLHFELNDEKYSLKLTKHRTKKNK